MGIEFRKGPHGETISEEEKIMILEAFKKNSHQMNVNRYYNNDDHFQTNLPFYNSSNFNIDLFLYEIDLIYTSKNDKDKIIIIGGMHTNHHISKMIFQHKDNFLHPLFVEDSYIRFQVIMSNEMNKRMRLINSGYIYHFLMHIPCIQNIDINTTRKSPIYVPTMPDDAIPAIINKNGKYVYPHKVYFIDYSQWYKNY